MLAKTNNQAELKAAILALEEVVDLLAVGVVPCEVPIELVGNSELVIKFLRKEYKAKAAELAPLVSRVTDLV